MNHILLRSATLLILSVFAITAGHTAETVASGTFVEKKKAISGNWSIEQDGETRFFVLHENFRTKSGPDLKIFLSPTDLEGVSGKTATKGSSLVAELKSVKGSQRYPIPSDINLTTFKSILIHCEKYAILWGGGEL